MGFPRQEYYNGLPFPSLGDLSNPGIKPTSPELQEDSLLLSYQGSWRSVYMSFFGERGYMQSAHILTESYCSSPGKDVSLNEFSTFLAMRNMQEIGLIKSENI